jgi:DNA-directed RNA polymerase subunit RPC12/RpoP
VANWVCRRCLKPGPFSEEVDLEGWREITDFERIPEDERPQNSRKELRHREGSQKEAEWTFADPTGYRCSNCDHWATYLHELVTDLPVYECHGCGWLGSNLDDHPSAKNPDCGDTPELVEAVPPPDEQESLEIAA